MEKDKELKNLYHTFDCIICGKELTYFAVNGVNKRCPCIDCQLKELGKEIPSD